MNENQDILTVKGLKHSFKKHHALQGVDFTVKNKSIHGFVGPNGAGKTTTLKLISTLLKPQIGVIRVFGLDIVKDYKEVRKRIGFMPDHFSMYRQMTVFEYLDFFAAAYGLSQKERNNTVNDVLELTDMAGRAEDMIKGLSRGMQQRVSLARVLVHDPDLLLLDEPASGLDPRARIELMEILQELKNLGKTVFISSHILSELADLCDSVTILDRGTVKYTGSMAGLLSTENTGPTIEYKVYLSEKNDTICDELLKIEGVNEAILEEDENAFIVTIEKDKLSTNQLISEIMKTGAEIQSFDQTKKHLNQAFMDLTEEGVRT